MWKNRHKLARPLRGAFITSPLVILDITIASLFSIAVLVIGIILCAKYYRI